MCDDGSRVDSQQVEAGGHQLTVREREDRAADQPGVLSLHPLEADRGRAKGQTSPSRQRDLVSLEISTDQWCTAARNVLVRVLHLI